MNIIGGVCEFLGVFLLSVEAIKLKNLSWVRAGLRKLYSECLNPTIEFHDGPSEPTPRGVKYVLRQIVVVVLVMFVMTPFAVLTFCGYRILEWIEQFTAPGAVGILGFSLWAVSFIIEKCG